ncbi:MAG: Asp-tRNA(Asn)/Glu-tRNA(Gln) amidotransferase subunit GatA [Thermoguttaceae bacterium]
MSLTDLTALELLDRLNAKEVTSTEVAEAFLDRIERYDRRIGAFLRVDREAALAQAAAIDNKRRRGEALGRLGGLPVAIKDLLATKGEPTTCASRMLENFRPPYDATVIARLKAADGVILGKTNMDEFAMGGSTENSAFQLTRNPWDTTRIPGGSSGGAAAAVAAAMAPLSVASDTGGSIRAPASWCGVVGLKPTYGRVSRYGLVAFASSLDQIGPLARTVEDVALLLEVLAGHDPMDSTSVDRPVPHYASAVSRPLERLRLGIVPEFFGDGLDAEVAAAVRAAVDVYRSLGATVQEISLPHGKYAVATYYIIAPCEASSNLARYDGVHYGYRTDVRKAAAQLEAERQTLEQAGDRAGLDGLDTALVRMYRQTRSEAFGPEVKRRIMLGTYALSAGYYDAYYLKAMKVRRLVREDFDRAFEKVDLIAGPVTPMPAYPIGEKINDPLAMYLCDVYTACTNLAGIAGLSIPCGFSSRGLPIGLHLQAPAFEEERLLRGAAMYQRATAWHTRRPSLDGE